MNKNRTKKTEKITRNLGAFMGMILLFVLTFTVYSAFVGRGSYKDVLLGGTYYFESNILKANDDTSFSCYSTTQNVTVFNYGAASDINTVDVTYDITFRFVEEEINTSYRYTVTDGEDTYILSIDNPSITISGQELSHTNRSINTYNVSINSPITNENGIPTSIFVTATPTSPTFMAYRVISRTISFASNALSVNGSFDVSLQAGETLTNKYAGFIYRINKSGTAAAGQTITVQWDAAQLVLSENTEQDVGVTPNAVVGDPTQLYITFPYSSSIESLTFFRVTTDDPETTDTVEGFVATSVYGLNQLVAISTSTGA